MQIKEFANAEIKLASEELKKRAKATACQLEGLRTLLESIKDMETGAAGDIDTYKNTRSAVYAALNAMNGILGNTTETGNENSCNTREGKVNKCADRLNSTSPSVATRKAAKEKHRVKDA